VGAFPEAAAEVVQEAARVDSEAHREVVVVSLPVDVVAAEVDLAQGVVDSVVVVAHLGVEEEEDEDSAGKRVGCSVKENGIGTAFRGVHVRDSICAWIGIRTFHTIRRLLNSKQAVRVLNCVVCEIRSLNMVR